MYVRTVRERFFNRTYANVLRELDHTEYIIDVFASISHFLLLLLFLVGFGAILPISLHSQFS